MSQVEKPSFASEEDYAVCRRLHKSYGTTYFLASRTFPEPIRSRTDAVYGFVRVPDEWTDNPGAMTPDQVKDRLTDFRRQLLEGVEGKRPEHPAMRAFVDVVGETDIPLEEPIAFLDAMEADLAVDRYGSFKELCCYMRGSAAAVALMMCQITGTRPEGEVKERAIALANAMQMTNFLRDVEEDARRGRIYLPQEDLNRFAVTEAEVLEGQFSERFRCLMEFEIKRTRDLYAWGEIGIPLLPKRTQRAVRIARRLYSMILNHLEAQGCSPYEGRARTTKWEKVTAIGRELLRF